MEAFRNVYFEIFPQNALQDDIKSHCYSWQMLRQLKCLLELHFWGGLPFMKFNYNLMEGVFLVVTYAICEKQLEIVNLLFLHCDLTKKM